MIPTRFLALLLAATLFGACERPPLELTEEAAIDKYLQNKLVQIPPSSSGLYYIEDVSPATDLLPASFGDTIVFSFVGRMLTKPSGTSYISYYSTPADAPIRYVMGKDTSLKGLDEALPRVRKGVQARLLLPSTLAYGKRQVGIVTPYTPLLLEIKIIDIVPGP